MLINLLIASAFILTTLVVMINLNRLLEWAERAIDLLSQFKSFVDVMTQAYRNRHQPTCR